MLQHSHLVVIASVPALLRERIQVLFALDSAITHAV